MIRLSIFVISMFFLITAYCVASEQPQVKGTGQSEHVHQDAHNNSQDNFSITILVKPAGVVTILALFSTLTLGLMMKKNRKVFPWHRRCAFFTGACAIIHSTLVALLH